jgi:acetyl esterase
VKPLIWIAGVVVTLGVMGYVAFQVSPWPAVLLIRMAFDKGAAEASQALDKHVPQSVTSILDERFDPADSDARLDVFRSLTTIVWVHGGGWVSGTKTHIANYAKVLAQRGFTVVGVDYSIAPGRTYPTPVRQVNAALQYLQSQARRLHVAPARLVLAGDSGGAHIAAQVANAASVPSYAQALGVANPIARAHLKGLILYCGPYDTRRINLEGAFGGFLRTVLWSYSGGKDFLTNPGFATAAVIDYITADFPPAFISAGNGDPLLQQSRALADKLTELGVRVDSLFFPTDYAPPLPHEYQFNLDTDAGKLALERSVRFLTNLAGE